MNTRSLLALSILAVGVAAQANMDQINSTTGLFSTPNFGVAQIFGDFADFSGTVVDDFESDGMVVSAAMAFELSDPSIFNSLDNRVRGWRVSVWDSPADAANSGNDLSGGAVATTLATTDIAYSTIVSGQIYRVDIANLDLVTGAGQKWIGMAPVMDFVGNGQVFIMSNASSANRTGGAFDSVGVNPGEGFGLGKSIELGTDAAYAVTSVVPEPATMLALGAGLAALAARRRK